eukprot:6184804-Pleurochrysis_carterae.AAC.1
MASARRIVRIAPLPDCTMASRACLRSVNYFLAPTRYTAPAAGIYEYVSPIYDMVRTIPPKIKIPRHIHPA